MGLIFAASTSSGQSSWTRREDFPQLRYRAAAFSIGDKGYVGTGSTPTRRMNDFWEYDPLNDIWQEKDSLPALGRESAIGFSINEKGYIGGGVTDSFSLRHDFWEYNPQTDNWTQKANIPIVLSGPECLVAFSVNGKGYVQASFNTDNFWQYDPSSDIWTRKARFPGGNLIGHVAFAIGPKGYIGTGLGPSTNNPDLWEYSPSDDRWIQKAAFPGAPRSSGVGFSIAGKGYIGLGNAGGTFPQDFWAYDPGSDSWMQVDSCGYGSDGAFAFSIGTKGYVGTGVFAPVGEFWEFDPSTIPSLTAGLLLRQNYPNPFNMSTTIEYVLAHSTDVTLELYDCLGRRVFHLEDGPRAPGKYGIKLNLAFLSSGIYFYRLKTRSDSSTKKLVLLR